MKAYAANKVPSVRFQSSEEIIIYNDNDESGQQVTAKER